MGILSYKYNKVREHSRRNQPFLKERDAISEVPLPTKWREAKNNRHIVIENHRNISE
jgi:hypothetical protein